MGETNKRFKVLGFFLHFQKGREIGEMFDWYQIKGTKNAYPVKVKYLEIEN